MSERVELVAATPAAVVAPEDRRAVRLREREQRLSRIIVDTVYQSARDVALKRWMFATDEEMRTAGLNDRQIRKVRQWECPKKEIAFGLEAANLQVTAYIKREQAKTGIKINVENAVIQLPEKRHEAEPSVYIDVDSTEG